MTDPPARLAAALADRYHLESELGSGGMATVYLAEDLKHDRKVAVKVLRPELAAVIGADRFLAEIKTTANLQNPHILPLYDSGSVDGFLFYVMPYIDGESLRDRLNRERQLPVKEAVRLATEIAAALDYAHRHGVVHRDVKPENILLHDGSALVADFGIALAVSTAGNRMTESGMSLGTPHYMSPEQAMGERDITPRSDVYALGCITYEMLVGEPPFTGPTAQAIVARVMTEEPRGLTVQRKSIPPNVEAAVHTALSKLPADRFASAAEFAAALNDPTRTGSIHAQVVRGRTPRWQSTALVVAAALLLGAAIGALVRPPSSAAEPDVTRVLMSLPDSGGVQPLENSVLAISPDGRRIAYVGPSRAGGRMLWVRDMNDFQGKPLPGTEDAQAPFFSPDGESIGFFGSGSSPAKLMLTPAAGGMIRTLVSDSSTAFGGSWGDDGKIYFAYGSGGISAVPAEGGRVVAVSRTKAAFGVEEHSFPQILPGSKGIIVQVWKGSAGENEIAAIDVATGKAKTIEKGTFARFLPPDILLFGTIDGRVFAARFDTKRLTVTGAPVQVLDAVQEESANGTLQFAVSNTGTLVYIPGSSASRDVAWVSRDGTEHPVDSTWLGAFNYPAISPDGGSLAIAIGSDAGSAVWVKRLPNGALTRLSFRGSSDRPVWLPDGRSVAYLSGFEGKRSAWMRRADGSDEERPVDRNTPPLDEISFTPDGRTAIVRTLGTTANSRKLFFAPVTGDSAPRPLLRTDYDNFGAVISPNGKWLAYASNESHRNEVYVRPYPAVDSARWTISVNGGSEPLWSHGGSELFFRTPASEVMAAPVAAGNTFRSGAPVKLFSKPGFVADEFHRSYDIAPGDKQFIMVRGSARNAQTLGIVLNWSAEIRRLLKQE